MFRSTFSMMTVTAMVLATSGSAWKIILIEQPMMNSNYGKNQYPLMSENPIMNSNYGKNQYPSTSEYPTMNNDYGKRQYPSTREYPTMSDNYEKSQYSSMIEYPTLNDNYGKSKYSSMSEYPTMERSYGADKMLYSIVLLSLLSDIALSSYMTNLINDEGECVDKASNCPDHKDRCHTVSWMRNLCPETCLHPCMSWKFSMEAISKDRDELPVTSQMGLPAARQGGRNYKDFTGYYKYANAIYAENQCREVFLSDRLSVSECIDWCNKHPTCTAVSYHDSLTGINTQCSASACELPLQPAFTDDADWVAYSKKDTHPKMTIHENLKFSCGDVDQGTKGRVEQIDVWDKIHFMTQGISASVQRIRTAQENHCEVLPKYKLHTLEKLEDSITSTVDITDATRTAFEDLVHTVGQFNIIIEAEQCWDETLARLKKELRNDMLPYICSTSLILGSNPDELLGPVINIEVAAQKWICSETRAINCNLLDQVQQLADELANFQVPKGKTISRG